MRISIPHSLPPAEALKRIKKLLTDLKKEHGDKIQDLEEWWDGPVGTFNFSVMGSAVSGTLEVREGEVVLDGKLPWAAMLFKGKIEQTIREQGEALLAA